MRVEVIDGADWLAFRVSDTGIGMTKEQLNRLFQPFTQADASTTRKYGGTGLGRAVRSGSAQMLGGDVTVESEQGKGRQRIKLPAEVADRTGEHFGVSEAPRDEARPDVDGGSLVLVVDDDPTVCELIRRTLERTFRVILPTGPPCRGALTWPNGSARHSAY